MRGCRHMYTEPRSLPLGRAMVKYVCAVHPDLVRQADKDTRAQMRDGLVKATAPSLQDVVDSKQRKEQVPPSLPQSSPSRSDSL